MMSTRPTFMQARKEWRGLELPKGTVIEVECVPELTGEVGGIIIYLSESFQETHPTTPLFFVTLLINFRRQWNISRLNISVDELCAHAIQMYIEPNPMTKTLPEVYPTQ